jgi:iodotyrosine deiodinase
MNHVPGFIQYEGQSLDIQTSLQNSQNFYREMNTRRSIRDFSARPVPYEIIKNLILSAGTAPSGAHKQPWTFCLVSNPELKSKIRVAAEKEEYESYSSRMSEQWLADLAPLGTDWQKPFLEQAPWLIIVFKRAFEHVNGEKWHNYYVNESVGIACGLLITAIHNAGLVTLTHTPSPMNFLTKILNRQDNERPCLLMPVGYAAEKAMVPELSRKTYEEICVEYR